MSARARFAVLIGPVVLLAACSLIASGPRFERPAFEFDGPPPAMDDVACDQLLHTEEIEDILGFEIIPLGRVFSSCHWNGTRPLQLVFNTSDLADDWREQLLETYTRSISDPDVEVWAEAEGESVAAFGPGRGVIVHGVPDQDRAVALALLALSRLR